MKESILEEKLSPNWDKNPCCLQGNQKIPFVEMDQVRIHKVATKDEPVRFGEVRLVHLMQMKNERRYYVHFVPSIEYLSVGV